MGARFIPAVFFCLQVHGPTTGGAYKRNFTVVFFENSREIRGTFNGFFIIEHIKALTVLCSVVKQSGSVWCVNYYYFIFVFDRSLT